MNQHCFKGCHVAVVIDEITLAHHTSLYLPSYLFKSSACCSQELLYTQHYFIPFKMHFLVVVRGQQSPQME